ncbi:hypothetical protein AtEden1_Chr3g0191501 [Arabidopsis thaliana]
MECGFVKSALGIFDHVVKFQDFSAYSAFLLVSENGARFQREFPNSGLVNSVNLLGLGLNCFTLYLMGFSSLMRRLPFSFPFLETQEKASRL